MGPGLDNYTSVSPQDSSPNRESKFGTIFFPKNGGTKREEKNHSSIGHRFIQPCEEEAAIVSEPELTCALRIVAVVSSENDFQSG
jgi:hypothetical protein